MSQIIGMLFNTIFLDTLDFDLRVLNRVNSLIEKLPDNPEKLKLVEVSVIRPNNDLGYLSLPFKKDLPKTLSFLLKGLGTICLNFAGHSIPGRLSIGRRILKLMNTGI